MTLQLRSSQFDTVEGVIDFGLGQPGASTLPREVIQQAAAHRFAQPDSLYVNYGPEQGDGYFLEQLAAFLSDGYGFAVAPLSLMVTAGASQAIDLIVSFFSQPGDTIFVEEPTYFLALPIFRDCGLKVVGIPVDQDGMRIDAFEEALAHHSPKFVYTIPAHHNPTGATLAADRRRRLVELSVTHGFYILADEVYHLLTYDGEMPPPMAALTDAGTVFSIGSFSKILGPGMRVGWIQTSPELMLQLLKIGFVFSGGSLSQFASHIVRSALETGLQQRFLETLKQTYGHRRSLLCAALREHLGEVATFHEPTGGFFAWVELPDEIDVPALAVQAEAQDVRILPGDHFSFDGGLRNCMRFCFAHYEADDLVEGVRRLARIF